MLLCCSLSDLSKVWKKELFPLKHPGKRSLAPRRSENLFYYYFRSRTNRFGTSSREPGLGRCFLLGLFPFPQEFPSTAKSWGAPGTQRGSGQVLTGAERTLERRFHPSFSLAGELQWVKLAESDSSLGFTLSNTCISFLFSEIHPKRTQQRHGVSCRNQEKAIIQFCSNGRQIQSNLGWIFL